MTGATAQLAPERLADATGDVLVLLVRRVGPNDRADLAALENNPLYPTLPAVRGGLVVDADNFPASGLVGLSALRDELRALLTALAR